MVEDQATKESIDGIAEETIVKETQKAVDEVIQAIADETVQRTTCETAKDDRNEALDQELNQTTYPKVTEEAHQSEEIIIIEDEGSQATHETVTTPSISKQAQQATSNGM
ncbi:hypothetical protein Droror1_Dr00008438 [Drosera rotundifolia]